MSNGATPLAVLQRALQAHIVAGEPTIATMIDESAAIPAATRLKIYSDAYRLRLIEALEANYPVLARLVGDATFSRITQEYLVLQPSRHFSIRWFGHLLPQFLSDYPDYRSQPWLAELAAWEWKIATAFDANDAELLAVDRVATTAPADWPNLQLTFHPSVQRITLHWNTVALVKATNDEHSLPEPRQLESALEWLIWRQDLTVQYRSLDSVETLALDAALRGDTFGEICGAIAQQMNDELAPLHAASLLKRWIADECLAGMRVVA